MDLAALNEKLRKEVVPGLDESSRQRVLTEIKLREHFLTHLDENLDVECDCGLTMTRKSYFEHKGVTGHPLRSERAKPKPRAEGAPPEEPAVEEKGAVEVCSCGLLIPAGMMDQHMRETGNIGHPHQIDFNKLDQGVQAAKPARKSRSTSTRSTGTSQSSKATKARRARPSPHLHHIPKD